MTDQPTVPPTEQQLDEIDTLPAWLYQRFAVIHGAPAWGRLADGDRTYWEHQARAVRRAVDRGGFKAASEATSAPLAASQPPEVPTEPETATEAPEGPLEASGSTTTPRRTLTPNECDAAWHAVEGAAGEEGADPGTVLHAVLNRLGIDTPPAEETTR